MGLCSIDRSDTKSIIIRILLTVRSNCNMNSRLQLPASIDPSTILDIHQSMPPLADLAWAASGVLWIDEILIYVWSCHAMSW